MIGEGGGIIVIIIICQRTEKKKKHEGQGNTNCSWCARNGPQEPVEGD